MGLVQNRTTSSYDKRQAPDLLDEDEVDGSDEEAVEEEVDGDEVEEAVELDDDADEEAGVLDDDADEEAGALDDEEEKGELENDEDVEDDVRVGRADRHGVKVVGAYLR